MPWLGDDICMKDPQALPGLSLVQWMNMQQNTSLANSIQANYMHNFSGSVLPNLAGADYSRQLGMSAPQIPQANNLQVSAQRLPQQAQQLDQLPKLPSTLNQLGSIMQPQPQQQLSDVSQQPRQNMVNQNLSSNQVQAHVLQPQTLVQTNNMLQQQPSVQNHQLQRNLSQNLQQQQQQQMMSETQQQNVIHSQLPDQINQQLQNLSDSPLQLQLFQKLQQQQQSLLAQQSSMQQPAQHTQVQDQQRQLLDVSQSFSRPVTSSQMLELPQTAPTSLPLSNTITQQMIKNNNSQTNVRFSQTPHQQKLHQQQTGLIPETMGNMGHPPNPATNHLATAGSSVVTGAVGAGQSGITDDVPSCSTSPSTNNCPNVVQAVMNNRAHRRTLIAEDMAQSAVTILSPTTLETMSSSANLVKDLHQKSEVKPSLNIPRNQSQGTFTPQMYLNGTAAQTDYLDTSSSTSVCLSQNDVNLQQNINPLSFNPQSMLFRETSQDGEVQPDHRNNVSFGNTIDGQLGIPLNPDPLLAKGFVELGKDFPNNLSSGGMLGNYESSKDAQQELSSSMVSQSFGVPDMTFNSIDSTINDSSFLNRGPWPQPQQFQRMRTYTKVCCF